jgi:threonyl-tRNA synthetase
MTELERIRHSARTCMATAILRLWPDAQFAAGPPVENGFYYDVELPHRISPEDFEKIEAEMKKEIKANHVFEKIVVTREQALPTRERPARRLGERPGNPSKFKLGNLEAIPEGEPITYFKNGDFIDLCAGPHVMRTGNIGAFKLTTVASAYYKGDEKTRSSSASTAPRSRTRPSSTSISRCSRRPSAATIARSARRWGCSRLTPNTSAPGLPLWLPKGTAIWRNWKSWPRKPNSPPATCA